MVVSQSTMYAASWESKLKQCSAMLFTLASFQSFFLVVNIITQRTKLKLLKP